MKQNINHPPDSTIYYEDLRIRTTRRNQNQNKVKFPSNPPTNRSSLLIPKCFNIELEFAVVTEKFKKKFVIKEQMKKKTKIKEQTKFKLPQLYNESHFLVRRRRSLNLFMMQKDV